MRTSRLVSLFVATVSAAAGVYGIAAQSLVPPTPIVEPIEGPQAKTTIASAINVHGEIVGRYTDHQDRVHAFNIDRTRAFRTLDFPGAAPLPSLVHG